MKFVTILLVAERLSEFRMCQAGLSASMAKTVQNQLYAGMPNAQLGTGNSHSVL